jgi:DNA-binding NarL/FixJ family response regulator
VDRQAGERAGGHADERAAGRDLEPGRLASAVVLDELALVRAGIAAVLRARGIEVAVETRSGREAVSVATVERPDLVVAGLPADLAVADVVRRLVRLRPAPAVLVLLPPAQDAVVRYLFALGSRAIALRTCEPEELGAMVDAVAEGERFVAPALHGSLAGTELPPLDDRTDDVLTSREREVLVLLAEGRTNREIAAALSVTLATVKSHLVRVYAKLEAGNRNQALGRAVALGLLG